MVVRVSSSGPLRNEKSGRSGGAHRSVVVEGQRRVLEIPGGSRLRTSSTGPIIQSSTSRGMTPSLTASGRVTDCPPKPNGSSPRVAAWSSGAFLGATSSSRAASTAATFCRETSPTAIRKKTVTCLPRPWGPTAPTDSAYLTLPGTSGNGVPTGSAPTMAGQPPATIQSDQPPVRDG